MTIRMSLKQHNRSLSLRCSRCSGLAMRDTLDDEWRCLQCGRQVMPGTRLTAALVAPETGLACEDRTLGALRRPSVRRRRPAKAPANAAPGRTGGAAG